MAYYGVPLSGKTAHWSRPEGRWTLAPGLLLSAVLAAAALVVGRSDWLQSHGLGALTVAILLGIVVGNTVYLRVAVASGPGVQYARQTLLRLGIVLYGLRLTAQDIGNVGVSGLVVDALVLTSTFVLACGLGLRWLKMDHHTVVLIGAGSSICGAAAVMATAPVLKARAEPVAVAVASVVVFGTLAIFVYPLLYRWPAYGAWIGGGAGGFGLYVGSTVHEVAQVVAAARSIDAQAADTAVIAKMVRVMMLAPFLLLLSAWLRRGKRGSASEVASAPLAVPWFAFGFMAVVGLHSLQILPAPVVALATEADTLLLATAMAALGLSTPLSAVRQAGVKPLLLAAALGGWLVLGGGAINRYVPMLLG